MKCQGSRQVCGLHYVTFYTLYFHWQKNEVSSSNAMELEGLKRAMRWMIDTGMLSGLAIECIITDRHLQVSKWIRENLTILGITHFYDVWHIAKCKLLSCLYGLGVYGPLCRCAHVCVSAQVKYLMLES